MTQISIEAAIANILWRGYESSLPDTPWRMATVIVSQLKKQGYLKGEPNA